MLERDFEGAKDMGDFGRLLSVGFLLTINQLSILHTFLELFSIEETEHEK